jgi:hypothetical protein
MMPLSHPILIGVSVLSKASMMESSALRRMQRFCCTLLIIIPILQKNRLTITKLDDYQICKVVFHRGKL